MTDLIDKKKRMKPHTAIGIASWRGGIDPETQICLDNMLIHNLQNGYMTPIKKTTGSMIANNRNTLLKWALDSDCKYLLTIDTDMIFPNDSLIRMVAHKKPIVSALAHAKQEPYVPNMYRKQEDNSWAPIGSWEKGELKKVDAIGGAFMLIELDAVRHLADPWFAEPPMFQHIAWEKLGKLLFADGNITDTEIVKSARLAYRDKSIGAGVLGEDYYFCELLRQHDIPIHVDTDLKIGHVGRCNFGYEDFVAHTGGGEDDS